MINGQEKPTYELWHQRPLNQNNIASWHQESPLGRAEILDIAQDSIGYIWLASSEGLIRFDGYRTKVFDLSTDLILDRERFNQVVYGSDGRLWFSNNSNLYYYNQRRIHKWEDSLGGLKENISRLEIDDSGNLWALSDSVLFQVEANSAIEDPWSIGKVKSISKCSDGFLWVVDEEGEVFVINVSGKQHYERFAQIVKGQIQVITKTSDGIFYATNDKGELYKVENHNSVKVDWLSSRSIKSAQIKSLTSDSQGFIWIESELGLIRIDDSETNILGTYYGLNDLKVNKVFEDRHGNIWIGTYSGVNYLYQSAVGYMEYWKDDVEVARIRSLIEDKKGNIWVGSENQGLFEVQGNRLVKARTRGSIPTSIFTIHQKENGEILIGGSDGLYTSRFSDSAIEVTEKLRGGNIRAVLETNNNVLWINLIAENGEYKTLKRVGKEELYIDHLNGIKVNFWFESDDQDVWIGTDHGLFKYNEELREIGIDLNLDKEEFNNYWLHDSTIWITSRSRGLIQISNDSIKIHDTGNRFPIKNTSTMVIDDDAGVWFGSNYGIYYIPRDEFNDFISEQDTIRNVEFYSAQASDDVNGFPHSLKTSTGKFLITTDWGLIDIEPKFKPKKNTILNIESYSSGENYIPISGDTIYLSENQRNVLINYSSIDFINYSNIAYEIKLEGLNEDWQNVEKRNTANYTNLSGGTYTFRLRIMNRPDVPEASIIMVKANFWYETLWFKFLVVLLIFLIIYSISKWRTLQVRAKNKKLQSMVDLRTHELNEVLNNLEEQVKDRTQNLSKANEQLNLAMEAGNHTSYYVEYDQQCQILNTRYEGNYYKLYGYTKDDLEKESEIWLDLIHPEDLPSVQKAYLKLHESHKTDLLIDDFNVEYRMRKNSGDFLWVKSTGRVIERFKGGQVKKMVGTITDISSEKQKTKEKLDTILRTEDNERSRISREIHDGLQQTLSISALNFEHSKNELQRLTNKGREKFDQGWDYLQKAIKESRTVAHELMPKAIVDFGLISACKSLISEYNSALENVSFHFEDNLGNTKTVDKNIEVTLYRILQESLNNIVKYAEANEVNVQLRDFGDVIMLTIEDNGKGFDLEEIRRNKKGFGLRSIENRIDAISGVFEIDSVPSQGTIIVVQIDKEIAK